jgi:hypothetical protein
MAATLQRLIGNFINRHIYEYQDTKIKDRGAIYEPEYTTQETEKITKKTLREIVLLEPLIRKGIWKENKDIFGEWFQIKHKDPSQEVPQEVLDIITEFDKKSQIKNKMKIAGICANIYGDGFLEIIYREPKNATINTPPPVNGEPVNLRLINPEYIQRKELKNNIEYYVYWKPGKPKMYLHPDRIIPVKKKELPFSDFGISDIYSAVKILKSKMNADECLGDAIYWAAYGKWDVEEKGADSTKLAEMEKKLKTPKKMYFHNENTKYTLHNPQVIDPKEYANYFYVNIAAALEMPQHILTGVQPGQLKGSEIALADYYKDIRDMQELVFTPIFERIYGQLLKSKGMSFDDYVISWNPIYVDERSEAEILKLRSEAAKNALELYAIDETEFRAILKDGITGLHGEDVLDTENTKKEDTEDTEDIEETQETQETKYKWLPLTEEQKEMIRKERLRGKLELELQEKRLKEAREKYGKISN